MAETVQRITCMEVWGGNEPTEHAVSLAGLDAWVYSRPFGQAEGGGDVYYVSSCAVGMIARLMVADVAGHGSAVADLAKTLRRLMRKYINHHEQTRFVQSMNGHFSQISQNGCQRSAGKPWDDDVTAMLFRRNGVEEKISLTTRLMLPLRTAKSFLLPD